MSRLNDLRHKKLGKIKPDEQSSGFFLIVPMKILAIIGLFILLSSSTTTFAQTVWSKATQGERVFHSKAFFQRWRSHLQQWGLDSTYTRELNAVGRLNSDGWSAGLRYGRKVTDKPRKLYVQLLFSEIKDEKQVKQERTNTAFPQLGAGTPFVFGKINNLYTLQLGIGQEQMILPAVLEGNLSVGFRYAGGFSLAMLKPYYLKLMDIDFSTPEPTATVSEQSYSAANHDQFLDRTRIFGAAAWEKGLGDITYVPGLFGEAACTIEPGKHAGLVKVVTLGIQGAVYTRELPIMAERKARSWNGRLFIGLDLGKRWNHH